MKVLSKELILETRKAIKRVSGIILTIFIDWMSEQQTQAQKDEGKDVELTSPLAGVKNHPDVRFVIGLYFTTSLAFLAWLVVCLIQLGPKRSQSGQILELGPISMTDYTVTAANDLLVPIVASLALLMMLVVQHANKLERTRWHRRMEGKKVFKGDLKK